MAGRNVTAEAERTKLVPVPSMLSNCGIGTHLVWKAIAGLRLIAAGPMVVVVVVIVVVGPTVVVVLEVVVDPIEIVVVVVVGTAKTYIKSALVES